MYKVKSLQEIATDAFKNPCDFTLAKRYGHIMLFCFPFFLFDRIRRNMHWLCDCDTNLPCKKLKGNCSSFPSYFDHWPNCDRNTC